MHKKQVQIMGYASCYGAQDQRCNTGPITLQNLQLVQQLCDANIDASWSQNITPDHKPLSTADTLSIIIDNCKTLALQAQAAITEKNKLS